MQVFYVGIRAMHTRCRVMQSEGMRMHLTIGSIVATGLEPHDGARDSHPLLTLDGDVDEPSDELLGGVMPALRPARPRGSRPAA